MKKNISINLFGTLYAIDEDAYNLLERYLDSMKSYFSRQDGGEEIADDIEHRVAELLWQEKEKGCEAVNIDMIKEIIGKIGDPQQIDGGESDNHEADSQSADNNGENNGNQAFTANGGSNRGEYDRTEQNGTQQDNIFNNIRKGIKERRLYRDMNDKMLGGVCSGLARYMGGDVTLWRLGVVAASIVLWWSTDIWWVPGLLGWIVPLAYLTLCFVVPVARTPEDYLRMRGEEVSPENINEQILRESNVNQQRMYDQQAPNNGSGCLKALLIVGVIIILFPLFAALISLLFASSIFSGFMSSGLLGSMFGDNAEAMFFGNLFSNMQGLLWVTLLCLILLCIIPLIFIIRAISGKKISGASMIIWGLVWLAILLGGTFFFSKNVGEIGSDAIGMNKSEWGWHFGPFSYTKTVTISDEPDTLALDTACMVPLEPIIDSVATIEEEPTTTIQTIHAQKVLRKVSPATLRRLEEKGVDKKVLTRIRKYGVSNEELMRLKRKYRMRE